MVEPLLTAEDIGLTIRGNPILHNVNLRVAAGEIVVHIAANRFHPLERLDHGRRSQRFRIEIDEGLLVEVRSAGRHGDGVEHGGVLPGLTAMRDRGHVCSQLIASRAGSSPSGVTAKRPV